MASARTFNWKPALVGSRFEVRVDEAGSEATRGSKSWKVKFADVTDGRLLEISMRTSSTSLVLLHGRDKFVINHGGLAREAAHSDDARDFVAASVAILEGLAAARPGIELALGGGVGLRWTMAILGLLMAGVGGLLAVASFAKGGVDGEGLMVIVMAIAIALGGLGLAGRYNPLRKPPTAKAADLATALRAFLPAD